LDAVSEKSAQGDKSATVFVEFNDSAESLL
jgi:hypothetical protein